MRAAAAIACTALAVAGCSAGTSNGFSAIAPGGWEDRTDVAETRTGGEFEVVYEGATVEGVPSTLTVSRVEVPEDGSLEKAAGTARTAVRRRFPGSRATAPEPAWFAGERALRFDYRAADRHSRYVTARRGGHFYAVTLQAAPSVFQRGLRVLDAYLASWTWDD